MSSKIIFLMGLQSVLTELFQPSTLIPWFLGMILGTFVGATPGLTATMAVALIVPVSFHLPPTAGLALIIGVSFTAIFAGDIPATFLRIPGTPASAAATLDGHQLAKQGRGKFALMLDLFCSSLGGLIGVTILIFLAPQLARFATRFDSYEYFWLGVSGLLMSALVSMGQTVKGIMAAGLGVLFSLVGRDPNSTATRFTFDSFALIGGLDFIPVMIGLFGVSEVLRNACFPAAPMDSPAEESGKSNWLSSWVEIWRGRWTVLRSAVSGTVIGALPGAGADIAAWGAYGLAKRTSKQKEDFGNGATEGVIAPTSANNAAVAGAWIPALVFGIPGDAVTAIVLGVFKVYGIIPGSRIFENHAAQMDSLFGIALVTQLLLIPCGLVGIVFFAWLMKLPRNVIMVGVLVFSVVGAYALNNSMTDVYVMLAFGVIGFFLEACSVPLAPLILGLILGPVVETEFRVGLITSGGDFTPFVTRPLCVFFLLVLALATLLPFISTRLGLPKSDEREETSS